MRLLNTANMEVCKWKERRGANKEDEWILWKPCLKSVLVSSIKILFSFCTISFPLPSSSIDHASKTHSLLFKRIKVSSKKYWASSYFHLQVGWWNWLAFIQHFRAGLAELNILMPGHFCNICFVRVSVGGQVIIILVWLMQVKSLSNQILSNAIPGIVLCGW